MEQCNHTKFEVHHKVGRLTDGENGPVTGFVFEAKVKCLGCNTFFEFVGLPNGNSPKEPMVNVDFTELRAPIRPNTGALATKLSYQFKEEITDKSKIN